MDMKAIPKGFSKWDHIVIDQGDLTVAQLLEVFPKVHHGCKLRSVVKHGLSGDEKGVFLFDCSDEDLGGEHKAAHLKRLTEKVSTLYKQHYTLPSEHRKFLLLSAQAVGPDDVPVLVPALKYIFGR